MSPILRDILYSSASPSRKDRKIILGQNLIRMFSHPTFLKTKFRKDSWSHQTFLKLLKLFFGGYIGKKWYSSYGFMCREWRDLFTFINILKKKLLLLIISHYKSYLLQISHSMCDVAVAISQVDTLNHYKAQFQRIRSQP